MQKRTSKMNGLPGVKFDIDLIEQLVLSMSEAIEKLEKAKQENRMNDFNELKNFILNLQRRINQELMNLL